MPVEQVTLFVNAGIAGIFAVFAIMMFREFIKYMQKRDEIVTELAKNVTALAATIVKLTAIVADLKREVEAHKTMAVARRKSGG